MGDWVNGTAELYKNKNKNKDKKRERQRERELVYGLQNSGAVEKEKQIQKRTAEL